MEVWFWGQSYEKKEKVRGVVGCVSFCCVGRNCITKTTQRNSFWDHFHPIMHQLGAKGDLKINKNNNELKTFKPKYKQNENRKFFECVAILLNRRAQRLHVYRCFMKKRCKTNEIIYIDEKSGNMKKCANFHPKSTF